MVNKVSSFCRKTADKKHIMTCLFKLYSLCSVCNNGVIRGALSEACHNAYKIQIMRIRVLYREKSRVGPGALLEGMI
jgi:hypothetical protein